MCMIEEKENICMEKHDVASICICVHKQPLLCFQTSLVFVGEGGGKRVFEDYLFCLNVV